MFLSYTLDRGKVIDRFYLIKFKLLDVTCISYSVISGNYFIFKINCMNFCSNVLNMFMIYNKLCSN